MLRFLQSRWMVAVIGALSFVGTMAFSWLQMPPVVHAPAEPTAPKPAGGSFTLAGNPEIDLLITDLQRRKADLDTREKQLQELQTRLQAEAAELAQITQEVSRVQASFDKNILRFQQEETANLKKLAKTYSSMSPESAAPILKALDEASVVKILTYMKEEEVGRVLEAMSGGGEAEAKRVAAISERLRVAFYRQTPDKPQP